jgi:CubicO group peptidase (beta-lactamase class C family)
MLNRAFAFAALLLSAPALHAQDTARMEQVIAEEANSFMGTVLVAQDGKVILDKAVGDANIEWDIDNTTDTKFRIGSVTKQFTAVLILMLVEEGKVELDAPIKTYLPNSPASWDKVTVRHLLHHTSGIPNVTDFDDFQTQKYLPKTPDEMVARFASEPLEFEPGTKWDYSNSGYLLLTRVVEQASGTDYESFLRSRILNPLGMANSGIDSAAAILPKRAAGYSPAENGVANADYVFMGIPRGAGAMYSTTGDLLKWQQGLFGGQLLKPESLAAYLAPVDLDMGGGGQKYALGVVVSRDADSTLYSHSGGIEGFNSWLGYDPDRKITVAVLANLNGGAATKIGGELMTLARGGEVQLASERVEVPTDLATVSQYLGTYALAPTFKITITQDANGLVAQATNQPAFPLFKEAEDLFFLKVVDARIRFERNADGTITGLTLLQNGMEMPATRE